MFDSYSTRTIYYKITSLFFSQSNATQGGSFDSPSHPLCLSETSLTDVKKLRILFALAKYVRGFHLVNHLLHCSVTDRGQNPLSFLSFAFLPNFNLLGGEISRVTETQSLPAIENI